MQLGIVGLPFSGKSTLFQAITRTHLHPAAGAKSEPHVGIVKVPDARVDRCAALFSPKSVVHATIEFVHGDMAILETRIEKIHKQLARMHDEPMKRELPVLEKCLAILQAEKPLRNEELSKEELHILKTYQLLTLKPMLIALSFDESQQPIVEQEVFRVEAAKAGLRTRVVAFFGKIDMEMSELSGEDARMFMEEDGIRESALDTLIREAYALLGLQSFLTVGEDECRAWTIRTGMTAQEAAGVIHSDFVQKFIRAEVVHYDDFIAAGGSFAKAKEAGQWRLEGKTYVVHDGDILNIRHG